MRASSSTGHGSGSVQEEVVEPGREHRDAAHALAVEAVVEPGPIRSRSRLKRLRARRGQLARPLVELRVGPRRAASRVRDGEVAGVGTSLGSRPM